MDRETIAEALREAANRGPSELVPDGHARTRDALRHDAASGNAVEAEDVRVQRKLAV